MKRLVLAAIFLATCLSPAWLHAQSGPTLSIHVDPADARAVLRLQDALSDRELENAARSGLPLRIRFRVELWKDAFVDKQLGAQEWLIALTFDPLSELFLVRSRANTGTAHAFTDYKSARAAVETAYGIALRPNAAGRYYYTASVDIETLSLSDLDELERWLRGELQPAVTGGASLPGAIGQGARRLFMRVLSVPERRFEARSQRFQIP